MIAADKRQKWQYRFFLVWATIGALVLITVAGWALAQIPTVLAPLFMALVLWFILNGLVNALEKKGLHRIWGTVIAFVVFFAVWVLASVLIFPVVSSQIQSLFKQMPTYINDAANWITDLGKQYKSLAPSSQVKHLIDNAASQLAGWATDFVKSSGTYLVSFGTNAIQFIIGLFMSFILAFWLLKDGPRIGKEIRKLAGDKHGHQLDVFNHSVGTAVGGYIKGTLIASACTGTLAFIGFWAIGLPYPLVLGLITGLLNIIPMIGPWIGGAIAAIVGIFVSPLTAVLSIVVTVLAQQITDSFISPRIMSSQVNVHPVMIILALLAGGALGGIVGTIVAVPILAALKMIFVYYFEHKTGRRLASADGAFFPGQSTLDPDYDAAVRNHAGKKIRFPWSKKTSDPQEDGPPKEPDKTSDKKPTAKDDAPEQTDRKKDA